MKKLLRDPLLHFLSIGFLLFAIYGANAPEQYDSKTVRVDRDSLLTFIQYQSKVFRKDLAEKYLANLSPEKRQILIDDYIREEVLYREAISLGFDKDDYIIRRTMVQKLDFITQDFALQSLVNNRPSIEDYFKKYKQDYYIDPSITFTHVYFNTQTHGEDEAVNLALAKLKQLNDENAEFADAPKHGERFLYYTNYVERTPEFIASHFGEEMSSKIFSKTSELNKWSGPFFSPYGVHIILTTDKQDGREAMLEEVKDRVEKDCFVSEKKKKQDLEIKKIIESYNVEIAL